MTGEPTPRPPLPLSKAAVVLLDTEHPEREGTAVRTCGSYWHLFAERPGHCQCGERYWDDEPLTSADIPSEPVA